MAKVFGLHQFELKPGVRPEDFEGAAIFLASDASRFMMGRIVYVDGGRLATF